MVTGALGPEVSPVRNAADATHKVAENNERAAPQDGPWPALPSVEEMLGSRGNGVCDGFYSDPTAGASEARRSCMDFHIHINIHK